MKDELEDDDVAQRPLRLRKAKTGAACIKRGCGALPAFENAEYCVKHGREYVEALKGAL